MPKPWEETWTGRLNAERTHVDLVVDADGLGVVVATSCGSSAHDEDRLKLAAAAPEMARLLAAIFNRGTGSSDDVEVDYLERERIRAVLQKAGLIPP